MKKHKLITRYLGLAGALTCIVLFIWRPSYPTPDKLLVFLTFVFMYFNQAFVMLARVLPFVTVLLIYESFRSFADRLNGHVNYYLAPHFDQFLFGKLPTIYLQNFLWHGRVRWYDIVFYLAYMAHFILPLGLVLFVWKTREKYYWQVVNTYLFTAFASFLTFFLFPAAPPWLASQNNYIPHIERISSDVWSSLGLKDFPSFYNHIAANPVAAVPSLHAAWASLLFIFVLRLYGKRWAVLAAIYPTLIFIGTIYQGEHYFFDVVLGVGYAITGYYLTPRLMKRLTAKEIRLADWITSRVKYQR